MELFLLPSKIEYKKGEKPNEAVLEVEPLYFGYGTTMANALRRVLMSSLPGAAVTAVKIKGVDQEFSAIENVKEDALNIILNLKKRAFRSFFCFNLFLLNCYRETRFLTSGRIFLNNSTLGSLINSFVCR